MSDGQIDSINTIDTRNKIRDRMERIFNEATSVRFVKVNSDAFSNNLMLIDNRLHEIVAAALVCHYKDGLGTCRVVVNALEASNPLNFPARGYYNFKFKELLCCAALGMTPASRGMDMTRQTVAILLLHPQAKLVLIIFTIEISLKNI